MLDDSDLDVVDIVVPPDGHLALTALAASRGVNVLVETPIAPTLAQADAMIDVCNRSGVQIEVAENVWRFPNELLKKKAIDRHLLGEVVNMQLFYRSGFYHGMSVLRGHFGDDPVRVTGHARALRRRSDYDANSIVNAVMPCNVWKVGVFDFPGGATAVYQFPAPSERGNFWEIIGTDASFVGADFVPNGSDAPAVPIEPEMNGKTIVALSPDIGSGLRWESPYA